MLKKEFQYYIDNQKDLVKSYNGKVIVIVGEEVVGSYKTQKDAYIASIKKYKPGTFLIIKCTPGTDDYTISQRSRIIATS